MATINREALLSKQRLDVAFKMFDKVYNQLKFYILKKLNSATYFHLKNQDGSGTLSIDEIKDLFGTHAGISEKVWRDMLKEVDDNGDGQVGQYFWIFP